MEQRRPRLGDIIDDYCPRERRLSNHAIVAMLGDGVKQTRCTTCDTEHPYKGGKVPRRRTQKEAPAALFQEVLAGRGDAADTGRPDDLPAVVVPGPKPDVPLLRAPRPDTRVAPAPVAAAPPEPTADGPAQVPEEGPVHRRLIRATLPRVEGQVPVRQIPEFTMRQPGVRRGSFRDGNGQGFSGDGFRGAGQAPKGARRHGRGGKPQESGGANGSRPPGAGGHGGRGRGPRGRHAGKKHSR